MTTVYGAVAVICSPKTGDDTDPPAGQVIAIAGTGGGGATGLDDVEVEGTGATCTGALRCVDGADDEAAWASDAGVVPVEFWPQLPTMPKIARTPTTPAVNFPLLDVAMGGS